MFFSSFYVFYVCLYIIHICNFVWENLCLYGYQTNTIWFTDIASKLWIPRSIAKNCIYIHMPYNIIIWRLEHFINTKNDEWLTNKRCIEQRRKKWLRTSGWETSTSMIGITFYLHANHTFLQLTILANTLSLLQ